MTRAATIPGWLALVVGIPQVMLGILGLYTGGWRILLFATLLVLPFAPLLLRASLRSRGAPEQPAAIAVIVLAFVSIGISIWTYFDVLRTFAAD